jgi:hypothetical protein
MIDLGWLSKVRGTRAVRLTDRGQSVLRSRLALEI